MLSQWVNLKTVSVLMSPDFCYRIDMVESGARSNVAEMPVFARSFAAKEAPRRTASVAAPAGALDEPPDALGTADLEHAVHRCEVDAETMGAALHEIRRALRRSATDIDHDLVVGTGARNEIEDASVEVEFSRVESAPNLSDVVTTPALKPPPKK